MLDHMLNLVPETEDIDVSPAPSHIYNLCTHLIVEDQCKAIQLIQHAGRRIVRSTLLHEDHARRQHDAGRGSLKFQH
jgi:hypothetical protein